MMDLPKFRKPREPVVFIRLFMATVGVVTVVSGSVLVALAVWRLSHPAPAALPVPRVVGTVLSFAFLLGFLLSGICWIMVALSDRLWNSTS